jgi:hypothetical protein
MLALGIEDATDGKIPIVGPILTFGIILSHTWYCPAEIRLIEL